MLHLLLQLVRLSTKQRTAHGQTLSLEQSLSMVSFLVETGIGCITYLRFVSVLTLVIVL